MTVNTTPFNLRSYQRDFADHFLERPVPRSLLVAPPGSGKIITALYTAKTLLERQLVQATLVITDRRILQEQWHRVAQRYGLEFQHLTDDFVDVKQGVVSTIQSLRSPERRHALQDEAQRKDWFIIVDEALRNQQSTASLVDDVLELNPASRALFISSAAPSSVSFDSQFRFGIESILESSLIAVPQSEIVISRFSPSFGLLRTLQKQAIDLDSLSWREFEKLIAQLLQADGYEVNLMRGSKDGGVDIIATKDLGVTGSFRALWQAKKKGLKQRVGISVIRELADTRHEFGTSKGVIVTSTYLAKGVLSVLTEINTCSAK